MLNNFKCEICGEFLHQSNNTSSSDATEKYSCHKCGETYKLIKSNNYGINDYLVRILYYERNFNGFNN